MVGWFECVAVSHPPPIQCHWSRDTREMEVSVPGRRSIYLCVGNWISISYLEQQDAKDLADLYLCDARRHWAHHGNVSLRAHHDRPQRGGVRPGSYPRRERTNQSAAPGSCLVKLLDRAKMRNPNRPTLPFCFRHAYF